ncbi:MAG: cysteine hydrolase [Rhodocyclaceae bacterium]
MPTRQLFIIDPQNDFCDLPEDLWPFGADGARLLPALPVTGAHADMQRLAAMIDACGAAFDGITLTLDSHQHIDIGHPTFWRLGDGGAVAPFTQVSAADVRAGRIVPRLPDAQARVVDYLDTLEAAGRYTHMVWPVHCEIGTWGNAIHPAVLAACNRWEERALLNVNKVIKGTHPWTEHYSAIMAEVPARDDASTGRNDALIAHLDAADEIYVAGEAASHCVKATVEHLAASLGPRVRKLVLIEDCMSPVTGFEAQAGAFLAALRDAGARTLTAAQVTAHLTAA